MKKRSTIKGILAILLVVVLVTFTACSGGGGKEDDADTIKIGAFGPLTGEVASYGTAAVNGVKLAVEEINANGGIDGKQIDIIEYDTKADKTEAINIYNRLKEQDEVVAIIGGVISSETLAVKESAIADGMPMITATGTALEITKNAPSIFRVCYTDPYQGEAAAKFTMDTLKAKSVAIMYNTDDPYSVGVAEVYQKAFKDAGLTITDYEGYTKNDVDYSALLTGIKNSDPDAIFLPDYYDKIGKIASQIRSMGIETDVVGVDGWDSVEMEYAEQVEGYYFVNHFAKTDPDELVQNFIKGYEEKYKATPNSFAALGYDTAYVLAEAIKNAGSTDSKAIVDALNKIERQCVTGTVKFDDEGDVAEKDIAIIKLVGGKHELVDKIVVE